MQLINKDKLNEKQLMFLLIFHICMIILVIWLGYYQYFEITPIETNNVIGTFFNGFINGIFLAINIILFAIHNFGWVDIPFYFINVENINKDYLSGFGLAVFLNYIYVRL